MADSGFADGKSSEWHYGDSLSPIADVWVYAQGIAIVRNKAANLIMDDGASIAPFCIFDVDNPIHIGKNVGLGPGVRILERLPPPAAVIRAPPGPLRR